MIHFTLKHPRATAEMLGFLPDFLDPSNSRDARTQFNESYAHGGGWSAFNGFDKMLPNGDLHSTKYDETQRLLAEAKLRDETIRFYEGAWVAVVQPSGSFEVCRMD